MYSQSCYIGNGLWIIISPRLRKILFFLKTILLTTVQIFSKDACAITNALLLLDSKIFTQLTDILFNPKGVLIVYHSLVLLPFLPPTTIISPVVTIVIIPIAIALPSYRAWAPSTSRRTSIARS